jgi:hypothetical protein
VLDEQFEEVDDEDRRGSDKIVEKIKEDSLREIGTTMTILREIESGLNK